MDSNKVTKEESTMPLFELKLTQFLFPKDLPNKKANFRFVVELRFTKEKDRPASESTVMPSLNTFWECDTGAKDKSNYVRKGDDSQFDMDAITGMGSAYFPRERRKVFQAIRFTVIDVNRKDAWDIVKPFLKGVTGVVGGLVEKVSSLVLENIASSKNSDTLFQDETNLDLPKNENSKNFTITGEGKKGAYQIGFSLTKISP